MKKKPYVAYLVLDGIEVVSPMFPVTKPEGLIHLCGIFKTRKQAEKFGDNIMEVLMGVSKKSKSE